jgi:hypothetical protein
MLHADKTADALQCCTDLDGIGLDASLDIARAFHHHVQIILERLVFFGQLVLVRLGLLGLLGCCGVLAILAILLRIHATDNPKPYVQCCSDPICKTMVDVRQA